MTSFRFTRHLLVMLAAISAMLLGACHDDGLITPPDDNGSDSCCAALTVAVTSSTSTGNGPLAGVTVALRKGLDVVATKETNLLGIATFTNVCNAEYNIRLTKDGYSVAEKGAIMITRCDTSAVAIAMRSTSSNEPPDSCCTSWLRIIPTNEQGNPVAGAQVKLTGANGFVRILESTLDGATFRELCRGAYEIRIARDGFRVHESRVEIGCGTESVERRGLIAEGEPNDSCCDGRAVIGARDEATGEIINGATIKLWQGGRLIRTLTIQGRAVVFEELCRGEYGYSISREGYRGVEGKVLVECHGAVPEIWRTLERMQKDSCCESDVVIRLLNGNTRQPVVQGVVKLRKGDMVVRTGYTNGDGVIRFEGICAGEYSVIAERDGFRPADLRVNVVCGQVAEATLVLMPNTSTPPPDSCCTASLGLTVYDGARDREIGLAGVHVIIKRGGAVIAQGTTNDVGFYLRGELCGHREYGVVLERDGYQRLAFEFSIGECTAIRKTVRMLPN